MSQQELKQVIDGLGHAFEEFKAAHDQQIADIKKNGAPDPTTQEKVERINDELTRLNDVKERLEEVENRMNRPSAGRGQGGDDDQPTEEQVEHKQAFLQYLRNPQDRKAQHDLQEIERKAVTIGTTTAGGHAVPEVISRQIARKLIDVSPMRQVATVETASTSDYKKLVDVRGGSYGWVGEGDNRTETDTPQLQQVEPTFGMLYAYPKASEESLQDIFFDVEGWLQNEIVTNFAKGEGIAFISGNGTKKPTGFLNGTPEAVGDEETSPARSFGELEYLPTGVASGFGTFDASASPPVYPGDTFIDTVYSLKAGYRGNARWMMNKATAGTVRKFKDSEGNYLWQPGLSMGQPATVLGYPVTEAEDMPDVGSNAFPVAFGDFREGYLIVDLVGMRITMDEITTPGQVKWYVRKRVGGKLINDDAIKVIKCATS